MFTRGPRKYKYCPHCSNANHKATTTYTTEKDTAGHDHHLAAVVYDCHQCETSSIRKYTFHKTVWILYGRRDIPKPS